MWHRQLELSHGSASAWAGMHASIRRADVARNIYFRVRKSRQISPVTGYMDIAIQMYQDRRKSLAGTEARSPSVLRFVMIHSALHRIVTRVVQNILGRPNRQRRACGLEALEGRQMLAAGDLAGTAGDDAFYFRRNSDGDALEVYLGTSAIGVPVLVSPLATLETLTVNMLGGDDLIIVDQENERPFTRLDIDFGDNGSVGDRIVVIGKDRSGKYEPSGTTPGSGLLDIDGSAINFTGVEMLTVDRMTRMKLYSPHADDQIVADSPVAGTARFSGTSGGVVLTPLQIQNCPEIELDLAMNDQGAGSDSFSVGAGGISVAQLNKVNLYLGAGANALAFAGGNVNLGTHIYEGAQLSLSTSGSAQVNVSQMLELTSLSLGDTSKLVLASGSLKTLKVDSFAMSPTAKLDLGNSDLLIRTAPGQSQAVAQSLLPLLVSGRNGGAWNGAGIQSSAANADVKRLTGLGILANDAGNGVARRSRFAGYAVSADSVLVKYTYSGDLNLDGRVDIDDYFAADMGHALHRSDGQGDVNFSGAVTADDYFAIDRSFLQQGGAWARGEMTQDGQGRTVITPAPDSRIIYVSSSQGNDSNSGLSSSAPVKTLIKAQSLLRDDMPDWMLLRRGDTWVEERLAGAYNDGFAIGGRAETEPMVIGAYGSGTARPRIVYGGREGAFWGSGEGSEVENLALIGIEFEGNREDGKQPDTGFSLTAASSNLLIEDCVFEKFGTGVSIRGYYRTIHNVTLRRSQIVDNSPFTDRSQGIYVANTHKLLIEENLIDHNGWKNADRSDATLQNHNIYLTNLTRDVVVRRNIIANASSHGLQARSGGIIEDNVFVGNPISLSFGLVNGADLVPGGVSGRISGNLFLESSDIAPGVARGWAIEVANIKPGSGTAISNNIFAHARGTGGRAAIEFMDPTKAYNWTLGAGVRDLTIENNVVYDWQQAVSMPTTSIAGDAGPRGYSGLVVRNNSFATPYPNDFDNPPYIVRHETAFVPSAETWTNNSYTSLKDARRWFRFGSQELSLDQWTAAVEPTANVEQSGFVDASRSVGTYAAVLGVGNTANDFLQAARAQSYATWDPRWDVEAVLAHVRGGFARRT